MYQLATEAYTFTHFCLVALAPTVVSMEHAARAVLKANMACIYVVTALSLMKALKKLIKTTRDLKTTLQETTQDARDVLQSTNDSVAAANETVPSSNERARTGYGRILARLRESKTSDERARTGYGRILARRRESKTSNAAAAAPPVVHV